MRSRIKKLKTTKQTRTNLTRTSSLKTNTTSKENSKEMVKEMVREVEGRTTTNVSSQ